MEHFVLEQGLPAISAEMTQNREAQEATPAQALSGQKTHVVSLEQGLQTSKSGCRAWKWTPRGTAGHGWDTGMTDVRH